MHLVRDYPFCAYRFRPNMITTSNFVVMSPLLFEGFDNQDYGDLGPSISDYQVKYRETILMSKEIGDGKESCSDIERIMERYACYVTVKQFSNNSQDGKT